MLSVFQLGRFVGPFKIAGTRVIGGFRIYAFYAGAQNARAQSLDRTLDQEVQAFGK